MALFVIAGTSRAMELDLHRAFLLSLDTSSPSIDQRIDNLSLNIEFIELYLDQPLLLDQPEDGGNQEKVERQSEQTSPNEK